MNQIAHEMPIEIRAHHTSVSDLHRAQVQARVLAAVGRFTEDIDRVTAWLVHAEGRRAARCRLLAETHIGMVLVVADDEEVDGALDLAARRLERALLRRFDRRSFRPGA